MIGGPERVAFINRRLVNTPMGDDEYDYWLEMFRGREERVAAGSEADEGRAHWVRTLRQSIDSGRMLPEQVAAAMRHRFIMDAWDGEYRREE